MKHNTPLLRSILYSVRVMQQHKDYILHFERANVHLRHQIPIQNSITIHIGVTEKVLLVKYKTKVQEFITFIATKHD